MGLLDDVINEVDGVGLGMFLVDLERPDAGCLVDGGILEASDLLTLLSDESQELGAYLDRRPGCYSALCGFCGHGARQQVEAMALEDA